MVDRRYPAKLDFFSEIVNVNWPKSQGRLLLDMQLRNITDGTVADCKAPEFDLGSGFTMLDKVERCIATTKPAHIVNRRFYAVWAPQFPLPNQFNYNNPISQIPSPGYDIYAGQFPWVFGYPNRPPGAPDPPGISGNPNDYTAYIVAVNNELAAHPGGSFGGYNADGSDQNFIATFVQLVSWIVPVLVPAQTTSILRAKYLLRTPAIEDVGDSAVLEWESKSNDLQQVVGRTFQQNVSKISRLKPPPDWSATRNFVGSSDWTATITKVQGLRGYTPLKLDLNAESGGGG